MELDKETLIGTMQWVVSEMAIEDKPLEWLTAKKEETSRSIANCERSAKELREYIVDEKDGRDISSEEVKELKAKLVDAIELEAELEKVFVKRLDEEIAKRLSKMDNNSRTRAMTQKRDYTGIEFPTMMSDLNDLKHKLEYELDTDGLANELQEVDDLTKEPTREMADELTEHIETYQQMTAICEELRRRINGYLG